MGVKGKKLVYLTASNWKIVAASCTSIGFRQLLRGSCSLNSWPSLSRNSFFCCFRLKNGNVGSASRPRPLTPPLPVPYPPPTRPKHEHETTRWNFRISFDSIVAETRFKDLKETKGWSVRVAESSKAWRWKALRDKLKLKINQRSTLEWEKDIIVNCSVLGFR